jgi:putative ABC transport system permease protein
MAIDVRSRIRDAFERSGETIADDVLDELTEHAETILQTCRDAGASDAACWHEVEREVAGWVAEAPRHARRASSTPAPCAAEHRDGDAQRFLRDLAYAARVLRRQPAAPLLSIATIALGITAVALMASVCWSVLKPLPWPDADRLVRIYEGRKGGTTRFGQFGRIVTNVSYLAWQERPQTIEAIGGWSTGDATMTGAGPAERVRRASLTPSLFQVLQRRPLLGRVFLPSDAHAGAPPVVLLSFGLWQERFAGRPDIVGRSLIVGESPRTIVGVMGPDFAFPDRETRAWFPMDVPPLIDPLSHSGHISMFSAMARLRPGVSTAQAAAEATARANAAPKAGMVGMAVFGGNGPAEVSIIPALDDATREVRPALLVLLAAAGLLLLAAAANVANIQLARAVARRREIAVRGALGATTRQLVRQLVAESLLVGVAGGVVGLGLATALHRVLPSLLPPDFPRLAEIGMNGPAVAVAIGGALIAGLVAALLPALHARRASVTDLLAEDGLAPVSMGIRTTTGRLRAVPMVAQVAVAAVLLAGTSLLGRTFIAMLSADRGFQVAHVLTAEIPFPSTATAARRTYLLDTLVERLESLPGVLHVGYTSILPLTGSESMEAFEMPGRRRGDPARINIRTAVRVVSPGYLQALGLRMIAGRGFTREDTATSRPVVVVNETFARSYLGDRPLDVTFPSTREGSAGAAVIGVVNDVKVDALNGEPEMFVPASQYADIPGGDPVVTMSTVGDPSELAPVVRAFVRDLDDTLALGPVMSMEDRLLERLARPRLYSTVLAAFAGITLLVASVGLFGVLSYSVTQRGRELAVRAALGASPARLLRLVVAEGLGLTLIGVLVGLFAAYGLARWVQTLLFGITPQDPMTYTGVAATLLLVSALACAVPALRAARLDPLKMLRRS